MATQKSAKSKGKTQRRQQEEQRFGDSMMDEVILIVIVVVCIVVLISLLTRKMGILGSALGDALKGIFGISSILLPLSAIAYCCWLLGSEQKDNRELRMAGIGVLLLAVCAMAHIINPIEVSIMANMGEALQSYYQEGAFSNGGLLGGILGGGIMKAFGKIGAGIIWVAVLLISLLMITVKSLFKEFSNVNTYQKNKRQQYHEKRQQMDIVSKKETYIQKTPKRQPKPQAKPQPKLPKEQPNTRTKLQVKQNIKKKKQQKSNFNILLHADEGYRQNKEEMPIVEATIFKPKTEESIILEPGPKIPVIFDYGKTENEILQEQQMYAPTVEQMVEETYQQTPPVEKRRTKRSNKYFQTEQQNYTEKEKTQEHHIVAKNDAENISKDDKKQKIQQNDIQIADDISDTTNTTNSIRYMIFKDDEELEKQNTEQKTEQKQQTEQEQYKQQSDTEDIADVLALLNSIDLEDENIKSSYDKNEEQKQSDDIMEIIADWAEEEEESSNGLTLFLAEDEEEQQNDVKDFTETMSIQEAEKISNEENEQEVSFNENLIEEISIDEDVAEDTEEMSIDEDVAEDTEEISIDEDVAEDTEEISIDKDITEDTEEISIDEDVAEDTEEISIDKDITEDTKEISFSDEQVLQSTQHNRIVPQIPQYVFPPMDLLSRNQAIQSSESKSEMLHNAKKLETTLKSFGVDAKVIQINKGPTVTRYELSPSQGVKVSKIVNLADDIALNLAASGIRIEAPIPGKAAVGIEVPNKESQSVSLRSVLESEIFQDFPSKLAFALGEDITGQPVVTDIAKMPHLLIAGATGSGKSVCINTLITSILYKSTPEEVKLLLVDPKVVELSIYNGIPHLLIPVVTEPKKASAALNWAVREMLERYKDFAENGVRDIKGYNAMKKEKGESDFMPQIVIIIDELADLMMAAPGEVEDAICRLAQMARAAGMHLIIATQRPSVDVITGVIKANIPSRLAFAVSSGIDSRTILDMTGAEKLLGKGDMLFYPQGMSKPVRIQGAFLSDKEVENIVNFIKKQSLTDYDKEIIDKITTDALQSGTESEETDAFFDKAVDLVIQKQKASTSMLQRQFRIGYNRAARLMESLESQGIVGPEEGSKPRKVLLTKEEWENMRNES